MAWYLISQINSSGKILDGPTLLYVAERPILVTDLYNSWEYRIGIYLIYFSQSLRSIAVSMLSVLWESCVRQVPKMISMPLPPNGNTGMISFIGVKRIRWNLLVVNMAAAAHGVSDAMSARSGTRVFNALTPTWVQDNRKPWGYVSEVGI